MNRDNEIRQKFKERLDFFHSEKRIVKLYRGVSLEYLSSKLKTKNIEELGKRLFFIGEKPNYCWIDNDNRFYITDVDKNVFEYIFDSFSQINKNSHNYNNHNKRNFIQNNKKTFNFFVEENREKFVNEIYNENNDDQKLAIRNYYFTILHQMGDKDYTSISPLISSTLNTKQAKIFSGEKNKNKKGIIINFWAARELEIEKDIIKFKGKPFKRQKEISLYGGIFPHYIYSFCYDGEEHFNPAIQLLEKEMTDIPDIMDLRILFLGLDINQENFKEKLKIWSSYCSGIEKTKKGMKEILI